MPYVTEDERTAIDDALAKLPWLMTDGQLTYAIFKLLKNYRVDPIPMIGGKRDWHDRASAIMALECAKLEFYRRYLAPYEDEKIAQNGDVQ